MGASGNFIINFVISGMLCCGITREPQLVPCGQVLDREIKLENSSEETYFSLDEENKIKYEIIVKIESDEILEETNVVDID